MDCVYVLHGVQIVKLQTTILVVVELYNEAVTAVESSAQFP